MDRQVIGFSPGCRINRGIWENHPFTNDFHVKGGFCQGSLLVNHFVLGARRFNFNQVFQA
jgi:hypothetical protein